jgi:hypothetical protein
MSEAKRKDIGPDFALGVSPAEIPASGLLRGHAGGDAFSWHAAARNTSP